MEMEEEKQSLFGPSGNLLYLLTSFLQICVYQLLLFFIFLWYLCYTAEFPKGKGLVE